MQYNIRSPKRSRFDMFQTSLTFIGIIGVLGYIAMVLISLGIGLGIPVAIIWILVHFIHNGYRF